MSQVRARFLPSRRTRFARPLRLAFLVLAALAAAANAPRHAAEDGPARPPAGTDALIADVTQGALRVQRPGGEVVECPLKHTDVQIDVSGFVARARVTQTFENPWDETIEAVYVFPLPHEAAVDQMTLVVGERRSVGHIQRRAEARRIYAAALAQGHTAALLEQERPNIFTQSVGNIPPRGKVRVEIGYVDVLRYDAGGYELHFPMVVGPRYIPGTPVSHAPRVTPELEDEVGHSAAQRGAAAAHQRGDGWSPDTDRVSDASRITPPVLKPGFRTGHDVRLAVRLDAGVPIRGLSVASHRVKTERRGAARAEIQLAADDAIPNKDFVLAYKVAGEKPELALLAHAAEDGGGYFLLMVQPRDLDESLGEAPPRDVCFLIDVSGSMSGEPTAKVIETMRLFFERLRPRDRVQVVTFAGSTQTLFPAYRPATPDTLRDALRFTDALRGGGGTEMLRGIQSVLADPVDPERVRVVVMLTDGYIGNEAEIIGAVGRRSGDQLRFWSVGVGSSPNRFLLDGVARQGGGLSAVLGLNDDPRDLVTRLSDRLQRAQLSKVEIDWGGVTVSETYPARAPELWSGRPLVLFGRYEGGGAATLTLSGLAEGQPLSFTLPVTWPEREAAHAALASVWARHKIEDLSDQLARTGDAELAEQITQVALQHRLMSAYTSFVAVDESEVQPDALGRPPRRVPLPLPLPEGVSFEGVFGFELTDELDQVALADVHVAKDGAQFVTAWRQQPEVKGEVQRRLRPSAPVPVSVPPMNAAAKRSAGAGGVKGGVAGGVVGGVAGGLPSGVPAATAEPARGRRDADAFEERREQEGADASGLEDDRGSTLRDARLGVQHATAQLQAGAVEDARRELRRAYAHVQAAGTPAPGEARAVLQPLLAAWASADAAHRAQAVQALPALARQLDLVLRGQDVATALRTLARAAGIQVSIAPGSLEAARARLGRDELRVDVLDLRGTTAAEALTALLGPLGLDWHVAAGAVVVTAALP